MKYLVLADIHSNLEAIQAVLKHAGNLGYERILCAGDIVGYNANPMEVIDILRDAKAVCIRGNHDREVAHGTFPGGFNGPAAEAVLWTQANITTSYLSWLSALPQGPLVLDGFQLVHGSPRDEDEYVYSAAEFEGGRNADMDARQKFPWPSAGSPAVTFFGHTHYPVAFNALGFTQTTGTVRMEKKSWMINPGSVGQPRDGDSRTSFLIWDSPLRTATFYRIPYNFRLTQQKILAARLPRSLADRLG